MVDNVDEMNLVVDVSCVYWMMRLICCISRKLHLSILVGHLYIAREDLYRESFVIVCTINMSHSFV
jgi:hypothetical protein